MVESSTKQYPNSLRESWEMQHLKIAPWPASRRQFSRGVLNISHISGAYLFPCPRPFGWGVQGQGTFFPSVCSIGFPKGGYH